MFIISRVLFEIRVDLFYVQQVIIVFNRSNCLLFFNSSVKIMLKYFSLILSFYIMGMNLSFIKLWREWFSPTKFLGNEIITLISVTYFPYEVLVWKNKPRRSSHLTISGVKWDPIPSINIILKYLNRQINKYVF